MIVDGVDIGAASHPFLKPVTGQVRGEAMVEGVGQLGYPRGAVFNEIPVEFWVNAWQAIGGQVAGSYAAARIFVKQLEELANNPSYSAHFIQWTATAQSGGYNSVDPHDGWYEIDDFRPDYSSFIPSGWVKCTMKVTSIAPGPPRSMAMWYGGGALASNYSGAAANLIALPIGSTAQEASFTRTGAEGAIPCILSPVANAEPFVPPSIASGNLWKGGVHVYDTINTGTNAVPTAASGLFVNANWVEVFGTDHDFVGDCVITNGLQLILTVAGGTGHALYLWNTAAASVGWQQWANLNYLDNASASGGKSRSYSLIRVGPEECSMAVQWDSATPQLARFVLRLQRGRYETRCDFSPLTVADASNNKLELTFTTPLKIGFNDAHAGDINFENALASTAYGYGAVFGTSASFPFIGGFLYQNEPGTNQPAVLSSTAIGLGDTTSLAINAQRSYGFFAVPFGVSGSYSTANLQAECESGTLGSGWSSVADAAASAGNTAELASGTASGNTDTIGSSITPTSGYYTIRVRYRNSGAPTNATEVQVGALIGGSFTAEIAVGSAIGSEATYTWLESAPFTLSGAQTFQFQLKSGTSTSTVNHFFDEIALCPAQLTAANTGPQDIWQQFMYDRDAELVVA